jgi:hypothetical protein
MLGFFGGILPATNNTTKISGLGGRNWQREEKDAAGGSTERVTGGRNERTPRNPRQGYFMKRKNPGKTSVMYTFI